MQNELKLLKLKILLLEKSVSSNASIETSLDMSNIWRSNGSMEDLYATVLGHNHYIDDEEMFLFHKHYVPFLAQGLLASRHYAPLSWVALLNIDNAVSHMFKYKHKEMMKKRHPILTTLKESKSEAPSDKVFGQKLLKEYQVNEDAEFGSESCPGDTNNSGESERLHRLRKMNEKARIFGLTMRETPIPPQTDLVDRMLMVLPTRRVIWLLIDRFFERIYPYFPFLDQFDFEASMERILGTDRVSQVKITKLNLMKRMDLIDMSILLLVLRFSYLTLFTNDDSVNEKNFFTTDPSEEAQSLKFLLNNPIDIDIVETAQLCLHQFGYLRFCNLPILQLTLYMKLYYTFAPENGDSPEDTNSQAYISMLIYMAMSLGLHREPSNYSVKIRGERTNNLCRKIWYFLLVVDLQCGLSNGLPPCTRPEMFDTLPPVFLPSSSNVRNLELEKLSIECMLLIEGCYSSVNRVLHLVSVVNLDLKMKDICAELTNLEVEFFLRTPSGLDWTKQGTTPITFDQAIKTKVHFQADFFLVSISYHFFNNYERQGNLDLAYFYLKKLIVVAVQRMMPFYSAYVQNSAVWFRESSDVAVTPAFQTLVHKCLIVILSILLRARFSKIQFEELPTLAEDLRDDPEYKLRYNLIQETVRLTADCANVFIDLLARLSGRYYYSWRIYMAQCNLKPLRDGTEFYEKWSKGKECPLTLTNDMIEDLNSILKSSLSGIGPTRHRPAASFDDSSVSNGVMGSEPSSSLNSLFSTSTGGSAGSVSTDANSEYFRNGYDTPKSSWNEDDNLWMQMISVKPQMTKSGVYSRTPPTTEMEFNFNPGSFGGFDANELFNQTELAGFSFFEPNILDPLRQDL